MVTTIVLVALTLIVVCGVVVNLGVEDVSAWREYAVCSCGDKVEIPLGDIWFTSHGVCGECGALNDGREHKVMRRVKGVWEEKV